MKKNRLYQGRKYLGYCAAKQEYYFGVKLHMVCDVNGIPIQMLLTPASEHDVKALKKIDFQLPTNSSLYADKAYNDYLYEDLLVQKCQIHLRPIRKRNSKRNGSPILAQIRKRKRRMIETAFSCLEKLMPRSIHAVTKKGFELKITLFVLAYAFNKIIY